jgi:hypothetical protein
MCMCMLTRTAIHKRTGTLESIDGADHPWTLRPFPFSARVESLSGFRDSSAGLFLPSLTRVEERDELVQQAMSTQQDFHSRWCICYRCLRTLVCIKPEEGAGRGAISASVHRSGAGSSKTLDARIASTR